MAYNDNNKNGKNKYNLTDKEEKFCIEYIKTKKTALSACKAGYCANVIKKAKKEKRKLTGREKASLSAAGSRLLKQDKVKRRIEMLLNENAEQSKNKIADLNELTTFFTKIMRNTKLPDKQRMDAAKILINRYPDITDIEVKEPITLKDY